MRSLCIKDQLEDCLPHLLQIESGLNECGLIQHIRSKPHIRQLVFQSGNTFKLTAEEILDQSSPEFSESQLLKSLEVDTYKYFCDVMEAVENGGIPNFIFGI